MLWGVSQKQRCLGLHGMKVTLTEGCWTLQRSSLLNGYCREILPKATKCIYVRSILSNAQVLTVLLGRASWRCNGTPSQAGKPVLPDWLLQAASGLSCTDACTSTRMGHESATLKCIKYAVRLIFKGPNQMQVFKKDPDWKELCNVKIPSTGLNQCKHVNHSFLSFLAAFKKQIHLIPPLIPQVICMI